MSTATCSTTPDGTHNQLIAPTSPPDPTSPPEPCHILQFPPQTPYEDNDESGTVDNYYYNYNNNTVRVRACAGMHALAREGARVYAREDISPESKTAYALAHAQDDGRRAYASATRDATMTIDPSGCIITDALLEAHEDVYGRKMPKCVMRDIVSICADDGADGTLALACIEYSASAPRPSWAYARAVMVRSIAKGLLTGSEFRAANGLSDLPY